MADEGYKLEFDTTALNQLIDSFKIAVPEMLKLTAEELWGNIRREAPVDHGRLAGSFNLVAVSSLQYKVESAVEYALAVNDGSKAHVIVPVRAKALWWPGCNHPVKSVNHPGNAANPYIDRSIEKTSSRLPEFAQMIMSEMSA